VGRHPRFETPPSRHPRWATTRVRTSPARSATDWPATIPNKDAIKEDRAAVDASHDAGPGPTPEEESAADRTADSAGADVAEHYQDMIEKGAALEGEGKPGL